MVALLKMAANSFCGGFCLGSCVCVPEDAPMQICIDYPLRPLSETQVSKLVHSTPI